MPEIFQVPDKGFILGKIQVSEGVDSVPVVATNAILASNISFSVEADQIKREIDLPYRGGFPILNVNAKVKVTFDIELIGNAIAGTAPAIGPILRACSMLQTLSASAAQYKPVSSADEACSLYFMLPDPNVAGAYLRFICVDARGTMDIDQTIGAFSKGSVSMTGTYANPTAQASAFPDISGYAAPVEITTATWSVKLDTNAGTYLINAQSLQFSQSQETPYAEGSQFKGTFGGKREETSATLTVFDPGSAKNIWALADSNVSTHELVSTVQPATSPTNRITVLTFPKVQVGFPGIETVSEAQGLSIPITILPTIGNDDFTLTFS